MRQILLTVTLVAAFLLRGTPVLAQDAMFSQFFAAPLHLNPAFAGTAGAPFVALNYRSQYPAFNNGAAYSTAAGSFDMPLNRSNSSFGIALSSDDAGQGILRKTQAGAIYSYKVSIREDIFCKIGIEAGMIQSSLAWEKLVFGDQLNPITGGFDGNGNPNQSQETRPVDLNRTVFDISTGMLLYSAGFHVGLAAKHLATPNEGFLNANPNLRVGLPTRWTLHGGYEIVLKKERRNRPGSFVTPSLMVVKQGDFGQIIGGAYAGFGPIFAGLWYRHAWTNSESTIFNIGFRQDYFKIGYSYDFPVGGLAGRTGGSHEVSLTLNLDPYRGRRKDLTDCFQMFR
jgi:type IX secretion system PorP/SprF family membrane protein